MWCKCGLGLGGEVGRRFGRNRCHMVLCPSDDDDSAIHLLHYSFQSLEAGSAAVRCLIDQQRDERLTAGADVPLHGEAVGGEACGARDALALPPVAWAVGVHGAGCDIGHVVDVKSDVPPRTVDCRPEAEGRGRRVRAVGGVKKEDA